ncbi:hypothetical protein PVK06_025124 [Gossypium arboreum]|uniref:Uncharacterized protein n=1 Tax=Gossypium arboreum TaxID=29729 RepID=A0ABR0PG70_GOSAR|nr:hypothetical protein PVK06_025124 [Gossypium arboreum]
MSIKTVSKEAIQAIHESFSLASPFILIRCIHQNLMDIGKWKLEYISREMNLEVDFIAKRAFDRNKDLQLVDEIHLVLSRPL